MPAARVVVALTAVILLPLALTACSPDPTGTATDAADTPIGPVAPSAGPLTLSSVLDIVTEADAGPTSAFTPDAELMLSGEVLASEQDYWAGVGGRPEQCAGVVSAPYLVSSHDTGARLDDPSAVLGTITELDEDRFGLIQVFAREFDDEATARAFLAEFGATVEGCPGFQMVDGATVTHDVVALSISPIADLPAGIDGLAYVETLRDSASSGVTTAFLQRAGIVISVYGEVTPSSTITAADADALARVIAARLAQL